LKRELPRLPLFVEALDFAEYVRIGRALGDLHVGYESVKPFNFTVLDTKPEGQKFSFRVEKMRFSKDRSTLYVNECITLSGFTPRCSATNSATAARSTGLWKVTASKKTHASGLVSDPNRKDEPKFILDLIGKVATVSLETQRLIGELPPFIESGA
jgi:predicted helicase